MRLYAFFSGMNHLRFERTHGDCLFSQFNGYSKFSPKCFLKPFSLLFFRPTACQFLFKIVFHIVEAWGCRRKHVERLAHRTKIAMLPSIK